MVLPFLLLQFWAQGGAAAEERTQNARKCDTVAFEAPTVPGAKILSIAAEAKHDVDIPLMPGLMTEVKGLNYCDVKIHLTHPGADDKVLVQTWLPLSNWNDRFQATGGGAWATGMLDIALGPAIASGYAASSTDGGHPFEFLTADWVLNEDKTINWDLVHNFGTRSLADQIYVGKSLTEQFYGQKPRYSYWNGCSQGGRQGHMIAQRYPKLLDGVLAAAPAIKLPNVYLFGIWPVVAMNDAGTLVSNCEFNWFANKALEKCDDLDGAKDGLIGDPGSCDFDAQEFVDQSIECSGRKIAITHAMAQAVNKVYRGPITTHGVNIFPGVPVGTHLNAFLNITIDAQGVRTLNNPTTLDVFPRTVLLKDPKFDVLKLTVPEYLSLWVQANEDYGWIWDAYDTDLSAFRDAGAKLLSWHGTSDPIIPVGNTIQYRQRVERNMGGSEAVDEFYRLFLAPGVDHCGFGSGPAPKDPLEELVAWVEKGDAPDSMFSEVTTAKGELVTRNLCRFPRTPRYLGTGDINKASSWKCQNAEETENDSSEGRLRDEL